MRLLYYCISAFLLFLIVPAAAIGQAILKGTIIDAATKEPLIGVNIVIQETSLGAATDIDGRYRITAIPEQRFTVKASYVGYETQLIDFDFSKTKDATLDLQMKPSVIEGQEVVVTGQMRGQLAAINQQISSNTIVNVISEEKIKELPDANAAEAIGRLPGVSIVRSGGEATQIVLRGLSSKFSNITIDGVRIPATDANTRDVDLSTISQGALAGVELYKTLTPDQDADAIAGAVNLVTKKAPSARTINIDVKGDYNHLLKSVKQYDFLVRYGERFFDDVLGIQLQGNVESKIRSNEYVQTGYSELRVPPLPTNAPYANDYSISTFTTRFTDETRKRNGGQVIFDINTPDNGVIKLSGIYSKTDRDIMLYSRVYPTSVTNNYWDYDYQYRELGIHTFNTSIQGKNYLYGLDLDWSFSYAHSKTDNPYDYTLTFTDPAGGAIQATRDHPEINIIPFASRDYSSPYCSTAVFQKRENFDKERTAYVNISKKYNVSDNITGDFKFGAKYKERVRWMDNAELDDNTYLHSFYYNNVDGSSKNYAGSRFENYITTRSNNKPQLDDFYYAPLSSRRLMDMYEMTPLIDVDALKEWYTLNKNGAYGGSAEYVSSDRADLADYGVTERIAAGYLMNSLNIGTSLTIIAGVRMEREVNDYYAKYAAGGVSNLGIQMTVPSELMKDSTTSYAETVWLPNIQFTIKPTDYLTFRMAAYKALARPDYNYRLPRFYVYGSQLDVGNPNLKSTHAWNYEVNTQIFNNTIGLISVSGFYKVIDNLFHEMQSINLTTSSPLYGRPFDSLSTAIGLTWQNDPSLRRIIDFSALNFTAPYNSTSPSYAWGLEFEHQMNFSSLPIPAFLKNITLSYNVSITRSETNVVLGYTKVDTVQEFAVRPGTTDTSWVTRIYNNLLASTVNRQSEGQPKLYCNAVLGYDIGGFSARLSVFYQDEYVRQYSANGNADIIVDSFTKWDLAFKQVLTDYLSLFLNINNLTNIQESTSRRNNIMLWNLPRTAELYGTTVDFGARVSL